MREPPVPESPSARPASHAPKREPERETEPAAKPVVAADAGDDWESQWAMAAASANPASSTEATPVEPMPETSERRDAPVSPWVPEPAEAMPERPDWWDTVGRDAPEPADDMRKTTPTPAEPPESKPADESKGDDPMPERPDWWDTVGAGMPARDDAPADPTPADGEGESAENDAFWDYDDADDEPDGSEPEPTFEPRASKPIPSGDDAVGRRPMRAPESFDWTLPDEYADDEPPRAKPVRPGRPEREPAPEPEPESGLPVMSEDTEPDLFGMILEGDDEPDPKPVFRMPRIPVKPVLIGCAGLLAVALIVIGIRFTTARMTAERLEREHDAACATLTTNIAAWRTAARESKTLDGRPGETPATECPADTIEATRLAERVAKRTKTLERANGKLISQRWDRLADTIAAAVKENPKAGKDTISALNAVVTTAKPTTADALITLERRADDLIAQSEREQKTAVDRENAAKAKAKAEAERKAKEKAEAERKAKEKAEAEAREQAQQESTPQYVAPSTPQYVAPSQPQTTTPKKETTTPSTPGTPDPEGNSNVDM
ncbi:hypothetical protein [Bifidobacterium sp. SO1]|uniref:hypothetical protein n=1 Tax=Bifidobacterium sp. SO1 TaxID=2809029 RepID=UPI001BDCE6AC|nr:hypothetical protein [Bifidobacterium sp. SO1]MBT1161838.1 hypothetical protein [Bifidobacterium sp. SO1]